VDCSDVGTVVEAATTGAAPNRPMGPGVSSIDWGCAMGQLEFDEGLADRMEVMYSSRDIVRRRNHVYDALGAAAGHDVLDVGCGPGFYTSELLDTVGDDGSLVAVDVSPAMLALAERRCADRPNVTFHLAGATALPVADASVDRAICVQVLEYVPDADAALAEIARCLRPGGRAVVWDIDWATLSMHSADPERMDRTLRAWDRHLYDPWLPRTLTPRMEGAGFTDVTLTPHAFATTTFSPDAFGSGLLWLIEEHVAGVEGIGPDGAAAWADEQRALGDRGEFYFCVTQCCFVGTRAG
jgi:arsenite methyltransferase